MIPKVLKPLSWRYGVTVARIIVSCMIQNKPTVHVLTPPVSSPEKNKSGLVMQYLRVFELTGKTTWPTAPTSRMDDCLVVVMKLPAQG